MKLTSSSSSDLLLTLIRQGGLQEKEKRRDSRSGGVECTSVPSTSRAFPLGLPYPHCHPQATTKACMCLQGTLQAVHRNAANPRAQFLEPSATQWTVSSWRLMHAMLSHSVRNSSRTHALRCLGLAVTGNLAKQTP